MYWSWLYDGKIWVKSNSAIINGVKKQPSQILPKPANNTGRDLVSFFFTGLFMGYLEEEDNEERVDATLRKAKSLKMREKSEIVNGSMCYVIEGVTPKGKYTIWLDPDHGYNIAQAVVERGPGDIYFYDQPAMTNTRVELTLQDIRFEKIDNQWVPMELTAKYSQYYITGNWKYTVHHKNTEIILTRI